MDERENGILGKRDLDGTEKDFIDKDLCARKLLRNEIFPH